MFYDPPAFRPPFPLSCLTSCLMPGRPARPSTKACPAAVWPRHDTIMTPHPRSRAAAAAAPRCSKRDANLSALTFASMLLAQVYLRSQTGATPSFLLDQAACRYALPSRPPAPCAENAVPTLVASGATAHLNRQNEAHPYTALRSSSPYPPSPTRAKPPIPALHKAI